MDNRSAELRASGAVFTRLASQPPLRNNVGARLKRTLIHGTFTLGLVILIAACSSGGGSGESFRGDWRGTWNSNIGPGGSLEASFVQEGSSLTGTVSLSGSPCLSNGTISGTTNRTGATFGAVDGAHRISFTARHDSPTQMSGTYAVGAGRCAGDTGVFTVSRISSP